MLDFVKESKFDRLGVFTYSHEENTHAHKLEDNVPDEVKHQRAEEIMDLQSSISYDLNQKRMERHTRCCSIEKKVIIILVEQNLILLMWIMK